MRRVLVLSVAPQPRGTASGRSSLWPRLLDIDQAEALLESSDDVGVIVVSDPAVDVRRALVARLVLRDPLVAVFVLVEPEEQAACQRQFVCWFPQARVHCRAEQVLGQLTDELTAAADETIRLRRQVVV